MPDARLVLEDPALLAVFAERCPKLDAVLKPNWRTLAVIGAWIGGAILLVALGYFGLPVWRRPSHALFPNPGRLVSGIKPNAASNPFSMPSPVRAGTATPPSKR
jgi:hypothetical protein